MDVHTHLKRNRCTVFTKGSSIKYHPHREKGFWSVVTVNLSLTVSRLRCLYGKVKPRGKRCTVFKKVEMLLQLQKCFAKKTKTKSKKLVSSQGCYPCAAYNTGGGVTTKRQQS